MKGMFFQTSRVRKYLFPLLAVLFAVILGISAAAAPSSDDLRLEYHTVIRNPLYPHPVFRAKAEINAVAPPDISDVPVLAFESVENAGERLRATMVAREKGIAFSRRFDKSTKDPDFNEWLDDVFYPWVNSVLNEVQDVAFAHTGNPKEGDYLKYQFDSIWPSWSARGTPQGVEVKISYAITYYTSAEQELLVDEMIAPVIETITSINGLSKEQKLSLAYDFITGNVVYDKKNLEDDTYTLKYTAYAALIDGTAVCQGYANLFYRLALELKIDARIVSGIGNGGDHAWNIVKLGSLYYLVDATWDEGATEDYRWYLKGSENFPDHEMGESYTTPEFMEAYPISPTDYTGTEPDEPDDPDNPDNPVYLGTEQKTVNASEGTVSVDLWVAQPASFKTIEIRPKDDIPGLELIGGEWLLDGEGASRTDWSASNPTASFSFASNTEVVGHIFRLTYKILDDAEGAIDIAPASFRILKYSETLGEEYGMNYDLGLGKVTVTRVLRGDMDNSTVLDSDDAIYLLRHTLNPGRYPIFQNGDVNGDGNTDSDDAIYLLRHTLNPTRYPLYN